MAFSTIEQWDASTGISGTGASLTWTGANGAVLSKYAGTGDPAVSGGYVDLFSARMYTASAFSAQAQPFAMGARVKITWVSGFPDVLAFAVGGDVRLYLNNSETTWTMDAGGGFSPNASGISYTTAAEVNIITVFNGASSELFKDGVSLGTGNPGTNGINASFYIGDQYGQANISYKRIRVVSGAPAAGDVAALNTWLTGSSSVITPHVHHYHTLFRN